MCRVAAALDKFFPGLNIVSPRGIEFRVLAQCERADEHKPPGGIPLGRALRWRPRSHEALLRISGGGSPCCAVEVSTCKTSTTLNLPRSGLTRTCTLVPRGRV